MARGLEVQAHLDAAFDALPAHLKYIPAIEAAPFWSQDGEEMHHLQDAGNWAGLPAALDRHLDNGLRFYAHYGQEGGAL